MPKFQVEFARRVSRSYYVVEKAVVVIEADSKHDAWKAADEIVRNDTEPLDAHWEEVPNSRMEIADAEVNESSFANPCRVSDPVPADLNAKDFLG